MKANFGFTILLVIPLIALIESGKNCATFRTTTTLMNSSFSERLNEYISRYETLNYNSNHLHASHSRAKRSVTKDHLVYLKFKSHGHEFNIRLKRDMNVFSDKLVVRRNDLLLFFRNC
jgi:hypothetical protein